MPEWFIVCRQILDNLQFEGKPVQPFSQNSLQRPTWYRQFPECLTVDLVGFL
jgi:hypothetical protein